MKPQAEPKPKTENLTLAEAIASKRPFAKMNSMVWHRYDEDECEVYDIEGLDNGRALFSVEEAIKPVWKIRMSDTFTRAEVERMIKITVQNALFHNTKEKIDAHKLHEKALEYAKKTMSEY